MAVIRFVFNPFIRHFTGCNRVGATRPQMARSGSGGGMSTANGDCIDFNQFCPISRSRVSDRVFSCGVWQKRLGGRHSFRLVGYSGHVHEEYSIDDEDFSRCCSGGRHFNRL